MDRFDVDPQVASMFSWGLIFATLGLLALANAKLAPFGSTAMASGLTIVGTVAIPAPILGVCGGISVLVLVGGGR